MIFDWGRGLDGGCWRLDAGLVFGFSGTIFGEGCAAVAVLAGALAGGQEEGKQVVALGAVAWGPGRMGRWIVGLMD